MENQARALIVGIAIMILVVPTISASNQPSNCVKGQRSFSQELEYSYQEPYQVFSHTEACWTFPFWCHVYVTRYHTRYNTKTVEKCCTGYYASKGVLYDSDQNCLPICNDKTCQNGQCTGPYTCVCYTGYYASEGVLYDSDRNCLPKCNDKTCLNGQCTGPDTCVCFNGTRDGLGYTYEAGSKEDKGLKCDASCHRSRERESFGTTEIGRNTIPGRWGKNCEENCSHCKSHWVFEIADPHNCDKADGSCICKTGWEGYFCDKKIEPCPSGTYGLEGKKGICQNCRTLIGWQHWVTCSDINANCDPWYGYCKCNIPAKLSSECTVCNDGLWGDKCQNNCTCGFNHHHKDFIPCDKNSSRCEKCEDGYWGFSCENSCPCGRNDKGEVIKCDKSIGLCDYCEHGFWGRTCLYYKCGINHQGEVIPCDKISPKIPVCFDEEYWGDNCLNKCTCAINATLGIRTSSCDQSTGNCYCRGYRYWGPKCDKEEEPCPPGYYNSHGKKREDRPDNYGDCKICRCPSHLNCNQDPWFGECSCDPGKVETGIETGFVVSSRPVMKMLCSPPCQCQNGGRCLNPTTQTAGECDCNSRTLGEFCEIICPEGKYGPSCEDDCLCMNSKTKTCNIINGQCDCFLGYWGKQCEAKCSCVNSFNKACNISTGQCNCFPDYKGKNCSQPCPFGYYKGHSKYECDKYCEFPSSVTCFQDDKYGICWCDDRSWMSTSGAPDLSVLGSPSEENMFPPAICPCQNGGRCTHPIKTETAEKCDCSNTDAEGEFCEILI